LGLACVSFMGNQTVAGREQAGGTSKSERRVRNREFSFMTIYPFFFPPLGFPARDSVGAGPAAPLLRTTLRENACVLSREGLQLLGAGFNQTGTLPQGGVTRRRLDLFPPGPPPSTKRSNLFWTPTSRSYFLKDLLRSPCFSLQSVSLGRP